MEEQEYLDQYASKSNKLSTYHLEIVIDHSHDHSRNGVLKKDYRIAGKFGGELNLAVWRSILQPPN